MSAQDTEGGAARQRTIGRRLIERVRLLADWVRATVLPRFGWRVALAMTIISLSQLCQAAGFIAVVHMVTSAVADGADAAVVLQRQLTLAGGTAFVLIAAAGLLGYFGQRISARLVLDYERESFAHGVGIVRYYKSKKIELTPKERTHLTKEAPRLMARSVLQVTNLGTSVATAVVGAAGGLYIYPELTALIGVILLLISPVYVMASVHSTSVGHRIRKTARGFADAKKRIEKTWTNAKKFTAEAVAEDAYRNSDYHRYSRAYADRLVLGSRNQLVSSLTFAIVSLAVFLWFAVETDLNVHSVSQIVSYLICLRLFSSGLASIFHGVQMVNSFLPFFLTYLLLDPRLKREQRSTGNGSRRLEDIDEDEM